MVSWKACSFSQHEYNLFTDFTRDQAFLGHHFQSPLSGQNVLEIPTGGAWGALDPWTAAAALGLLMAAALGR